MVGWALYLFLYCQSLTAPRMSRSLRYGVGLRTKTWVQTRIEDPSTFDHKEIMKKSCFRRVILNAPINI